MSFFSIARKIHQLEARSAIVGGALALAMSAFGCYQIWHSGHSYDWNAAASNPHWMRQAASPAALVVAAFLTPAVSLYLFVMHLGAGVGAMLNHQVFDGLLLWLMGFLTLIPSAIGGWSLKLRQRGVDWLERLSNGSKGKAVASTQAGGGSNNDSLAGDLIDIRPARLSFDDLKGMHDLKEKLASAARSSLIKGAKAQNGILLHGEPGNGKTSVAEALAGELQLPFIPVTIGDIGSRFIGQTAEQLKLAFDVARQKAPCVLFLDEIDSVVRDRSGSASTNDDDRRTTNVFLTESVRLRGTGVVLVAATNHFDSLDLAAVREGRFDFKIEVPNPDYEARLSILKKGTARSQVSGEILDAVARRWVGFSVSRLMAVCAKLPTGASLQYCDFALALRSVQGRSTAISEIDQRLDQLVLSSDNSKRLKALAHNLQNSFEVERKGGAIPSGILFHGPSGTGKTATARALSNECGWSFITTSGSELARDPKAIASIYRKACDSRPAIIWIDEADDVLRSRDRSFNTAATNELLAVMDGVKGRVPDVVFIAATNHPDEIDPAMLRGGRFSEKFLMDLPTAEQVQAYAQNFLTKKGWTADDLRLDVMSIADCTALLQSAINAAIARNAGNQHLLSCDVAQARAAVLGG